MGQAPDKMVIEGIETAPDVEGLAQRINEICRSATLDLAFKIGEIVIKKLFGHSTQLWERTGRRARSYRALAACGDLMLSASALCRAVGVYALIERLGGRARWRHLTASHFQEVLSLEAGPRNTLLQEAEEKHWSVAHLRAEASHHRRGRGTRAGLQVRPLRRIGSNLAAYNERLSKLELSQLRDEHLQSLRQAAQELHRVLETLDELLGTEEDTRPRYDSDVAELKGARRAYAGTAQKE